MPTKVAWMNAVLSAIAHIATGAGGIFVKVWVSLQAIQLLSF